MIECICWWFKKDSTKICDLRNNNLIAALVAFAELFIATVVSIACFAPLQFLSEIFVRVQSEQIFL